MSKNNNVNPGNYKTAGREPQGQAVPHEVARQEYAREKAQEKREELHASDRQGGASAPTKTSAPLKKGKPSAEPQPRES
jgi:hypothetical protein